MVFYGNRRQRSNETEAFGETGISYQDKLDNDRNLFKLTATVKPGSPAGRQLHA